MNHIQHIDYQGMNIYAYLKTDSYYQLFKIYNCGGILMTILDALYELAGAILTTTYNLAMTLTAEMLKELALDV